MNKILETLASEPGLLTVQRTARLLSHHRDTIYKAENRFVADFAAALLKWYVSLHSLEGRALKVITVEILSKSWRVVHATQAL